MNRQAIIGHLNAEKPYLKKQFGLDEIALFGSFARGEETPDSDVDILVSLKKPSYSLLMGLYIYIECKLNIKINIVRKGPHISERFLKYISKDLIYI